MNDFTVLIDAVLSILDLDIDETSAWKIDAIEEEIREEFKKELARRESE